MKKLFLMFLAVFFIIPFVFAEITIKTDQDIYNLGSRISASASVLQDKDFNGLFRLAISCGNYELTYFLTPVSLESNFRTGVNVPELAATSPMLGNCRIKGDLLTNDNLVIEQKESNKFEITKQLTILPVRSEVTALPGDSIQIAGVVNEAFGSNVLKASINIILDDNSYETNAIDGKFEYTLQISKNIKSGNHIIEISAFDSKGNSGTSSIELEITAVPSNIKAELSSYELLPGSKVVILPSLYDQAGDLINASLEIELTAPDGNKIFKKTVQSNEKIEHEFSQYSKPGSYVLASAYRNLLDKASINITKVREVIVKYENETVVVENIGNVLFEDELTFFLESGSKKYPITKNVKVNPGKIIGIDLSKEVPSGIYDVLLEIKEGIGPVKDKIGEAIQGMIGEVIESSDLPQEETILADDVEIHDNRPFYRKIGSSFSSVSAFLAGTDGLLARNPLLAPSILIIIVLAIVFRYGRKPIMKLIRRKKDEKDES